MNEHQSADQENRSGSGSKMQAGFGKSPSDKRLRLDPQLIVVMAGSVMLVCALLADRWFETPEQPGMLAMLAAILLGTPIVYHAAVDLAQRDKGGSSSHMEELVALAVLASFASGQYIEAASVALFMVLADFIEDRTAAGARQTIESLVRITPTKARRVVDDREMVVSAGDLVPGDTVLVAPGDNVPCDGVVLSGSSALDEQSITGESLPVDKVNGDRVFAGSINQTGALRIRVEKPIADSTLGRVQSLIIQAASSKTPITRMLDQYAGYYTALVLCIAGIVVFFTRDIDRAISLLLIACPCAIILSGPTALVAALSAAARLGVLIKNVTDIEIAQKLTAIVLDKTGTLTTGNLAVTRLHPVADTDPADLLRMAASLEKHSRHPIARAVVAMSERARIDLAPVEAFEEVAGRGVRGTLDNRQIMAGRESWIRECGVYIPANLLDDAGSMSVLLLAEKGRCIGWVGLSDQTREGAGAILNDLRELGLQQRMMVTGDRRGPAEHIAESLDLTGMVAEALPGDKLDIVRQLKQRGHTVAVIGDGVNDGPALAAADLSIAMGAAGSDVAINAASIALMNSQLNRLPFLIRLSRAATRVIRQNIVFVMLYIFTMIVMLSLGYITPLVAAIAHGLSSIVVVFNSARLIRQGEDLPLLEDMERDRAAQAAKRARRTQPMPVATSGPVIGRIAGAENGTGPNAISISGKRLLGE